jgi:hypothetical protein
MFSIPSPNTSLALTEPIFIDENAEALATVMSELSNHRRIEDEEYSSWGIVTLEAALRIYEKFDIQHTRHEMEERLDGLIENAPYEAFVIASRQHNLDLGRKAIKLMTLPNDVTVGGDLNIWSAISGARLSWQVALMRLLVPQPKISNKLYTYVPLAGLNVDLDEVAEKFHPQ